MATSNKRIIAIIGPTASGKSDLALGLARKFGGEILSIDSLAIYKGFDIFSNKPPLSVRQEIIHHGISILEPYEHANAKLFSEILESKCKSDNRDERPLFIVGGSSFYLKSIIDGLSEMPKLSLDQKMALDSKIKSLQSPFEVLKRIDPSSKINSADTFRIYKALELYFSTGLTQSEYFARHKRRAFPHKIEIYNIAVSRDQLKSIIAKRTKNMLDSGAVREVQEAYEKYANLKSYQCARAIGVKDAIEFIEKKINPEQLENQINKNTLLLAKRQITFNTTQFKNVFSADPKTLSAELHYRLEYGKI